jgi:hypothetical protein
MKRRVMNTGRPSHIDTPGSAQAVAGGCTCDLIKNDFGRGKADSNGIAFHCAETCPVHGELNSTVSPVRGRGLFIYEYPSAFNWLKSRLVRFRKGSTRE